MINKEKANLVIVLLIKYFETYFPQNDFYKTLYSYNEETDVTFWDANEYKWSEEFNFVIGDDKYVFDVMPYSILSVDCKNPDNTYTCIMFNEVMEKCYELNSPKGQWDVLIEYLQKRLGEDTVDNKTN